MSAVPGAAVPGAITPGDPGTAGTSGPLPFPDTPLDIRAELLINGTWTNCTPDLDHGPITVGRGHPDESTQTSPSTLGLTFTNTTGKYSSKNPVSPLYPYLMRNVPCRVSIPSQQNYLRMEADNSSGAACPDASPLRISGDLDVRADVWLSDWRYADILQNWGATSGTGSWAFGLAAGNANMGNLILQWSPNGTTVLTAVSAMLAPAGRVAVRATLQVSTGTVTFYTGPAGGADGSTWAQFGSAVVSGATTLNAGTNGIAVGVGLSPPGMYGRVYEAEVRSGIGGTVVAHPVFSAQSAGTTSFADAQGNMWTLSGTAELSSREYRLHAEVPEWPQHQDESGKSVTVAAAGGGLLRRTSQRNNPVNSSMYRAYTRIQAYAFPVAYWAMEDVASASSLASALGGPPMYFSGSPQLASSSAFAASSPLPVINGAVLTGTVTLNAATTWTDNVTRFLCEFPSGGEADQTVVASVSSLGTVATLNLRYNAGPSLTLTGFDVTGNVLFTSGAVAFTNVSLNGGPARLSMEVRNAGGGNITPSMVVLGPGAATGQGWTGTSFAGTVGPVTRVQFNPYGANGLTGTVLGHASVQPVWDTLFDLDDYLTPAGVPTGALNAWIAEPAAVRFARLCSEEGIQCRIRGDMNTTAPMGAQTAQTMTQLLQECVDADRGVMTELRAALGFGYVCRNALYNQAAGVTADYDQDHMAMWAADPKEDDQTTTNDITLTQGSGSSSGSGAGIRVYAAPGQPIPGGRLSTLPPPNGMGTYDQSYTVNLQNAADLYQLAGWMVHVGTVDQPRYPGIGLDLTNRDLAPLFWAILGMELGDRLVINDLPVQYGPDPVSQLAQQVNEKLWYDTLTIDVTGVPEQPYEVAADGAGFHVDTDGTTLTSGVSSSATSMSFTTAAGYPLWSTSAGDYPCDVNIAGERVTITAMSGSSSPQAATVARSVNGVVKSQAASAAVSVFQTPVAAL